MRTPNKSRRQQVTIKDVAREAGVSVMSVSNVLNGRGRVSVATAEMIREVVERLGYRPSMAARRLRASEKSIIGMIIVAEDPDFLGDPFITAQVTGLTNYLSARSYSLMLRGIRPSEFHTTDLFQDIQADGIVAILSGTQEQRDWFIGQLAALSIPLVLLQELGTSLPEDCALVRQSDHDGGRQLGAHLLASGAKAVWGIRPETEWAAMTARMAGVDAALGVAGAARLRMILSRDESFEAVFAATSAVLAAGEPVDAIAAGNDQIAIAAVRACQAMGRAVPDEIQITGFNAFENWRYVDPPLTSVSSSAHQLGAKAAELLIGRLSSGAFDVRELVLPVALQLGRSTRAAGRETPVAQPK